MPHGIILKEVKRLLNNIQKGKERLDEARLLPIHILRTQQEKMFLEWTYHSNVIEGNALMLQEHLEVGSDFLRGGNC